MTDRDRSTRRMQRDLELAERGRKSLMVATVVTGVLGTLILAAVAFAVIRPSDPAGYAAGADLAAGAPSAESTATAEADAPAESAPGITSPKRRPDAQPAPKSVRSPKPAPRAKRAPGPTQAPSPAPKPAPALQKASIAIGATGFEPSSVSLKAGIPAQLTVAKGEGCAAGFLLPQLGIAADNTGGAATVKVPALDPGTYRFTCGMEMITGFLVIR